LLLGGTPFTDEVIMWWNFIGRSHEEIVEYRQRSDNRDAQFGEVTGYRGAISHLPAPPLPNAILRPRPAPGAGY
jgi:quercetin 2,3-dioxygenase